MTSTPEALTFDAAQLARGWLATSLASGSDESLPILCGLSIEAYPGSVVRGVAMPMRLAEIEAVA